LTLRIDCKRVLRKASRWGSLWRATKSSLTNGRTGSSVWKVELNRGTALFKRRTSRLKNWVLSWKVWKLPWKI
jgi:hypothetical protein